MNRFDLAYLAACVPAAPVLAARLIADPRYRHRLTERFGLFTEKDGLDAPVWIHAASVGEVNAAQPLIEALGRAAPRVPIVMTTLTMTGRERAGRIKSVARFRYAPFDFGACVEQAFRRWRPRLLVVVEHELWPNLYLTAARHGVPVVIVNARMGERSLARYRRMEYSLRPVISAIHRVLAQDAPSAERWRALGVPADRVIEAGNLKFDGASVDADPTEVRRRLGLAPDALVVLGGSTHAPEEEWLLDAVPRNVQLILAPRYPEQRSGDIERLIERKGMRCRRLRRRLSTEGVLLIDRLGELKRLYTIASVAFVGGSVAAKGGHNLLEAAICGVPIVVGPSQHNTQEISDALREAGALEVVRRPEELQQSLSTLLADAELRRMRGAAARAVAMRGAGAVQRHVDAVLDLIQTNSAAS